MSMRSHLLRCDQHRCHATRAVSLIWPTMILMLVLIATPHSGLAQGPKLGHALTENDISQLPQHVFPDGTGLPPGSGSSSTGKPLYGEHCAACHGGRGEGGTAIELIGDRASLTSEYPDRGIGVYWPHAPTLFEYIRRSMPPDKPYSLSVDDVYAVIAHLLELNTLIEPGQVVDATTLSALKMPNRDGFIDRVMPSFDRSSTILRPYI